MCCLASKREAISISFVVTISILNSSPIETWKIEANPVKSITHRWLSARLSNSIANALELQQSCAAKSSI